MSDKKKKPIPLRPVIVGKGSAKYSVVFESHKALPSLVAARVKSSQSVVIISDATAHALYRQLIKKMLLKIGKRATFLTIPSGERYKNTKELMSLLESIISLGVDRSTTIVAFGGGVTTDIAGCVAAMLLRGVKWIAVPTTFLGMIDASIGGKTGVNSKQGKNLIGAFWPPEVVIVSADFIRTQPQIEFIGSLGEATKYYAIAGKPSLAELHKLQQDFPNHESSLAQKIIKKCAQIKANIVTSDEREKGARAFLNFGHTIGHAIESCGDYRHISHGRAVASGMVGAIAISVAGGLKLTPDIIALDAYCKSIASGRRVTIDRDEVIAKLVFDKKRSGGKLMFVLLDSIGKPYLAQAPAKRILERAVELSIKALL